MIAVNSTHSISPDLSFSIKSECRWDWAVCLLWLGINRALHSYTNADQKKGRPSGYLGPILHYRSGAISLEILYIQPEKGLRSLQFTKIGPPNMTCTKAPHLSCWVTQGLFWLGITEHSFVIYKPRVSWLLLVSLTMLIYFLMLEVKIIIYIRPGAFESC